MSWLAVGVVGEMFWTGLERLWPGVLPGLNDVLRVGGNLGGSVSIS